MKQEIITIDLGGVNSYLLKSDNGFILVDTGGHLVMDKEFSNRLDLLKQKLENNGCTSENIKLILLTHGDIDHVCNAAYLRDKYQTKIALHKNDWYLVEQLNIQDFMHSFHYRSLILKIVFILMGNTIRKVGKKTVESFNAFTPDIVIDEKFKLSDLGFDGKIIHVPGHTSDSVAILTKNGELIAGDMFSNIKKPKLCLMLLTLIC